MKKRDKIKISFLSFETVLNVAAARREAFQILCRKGNYVS
jgi:hypothetical protein